MSETTSFPFDSTPGAPAVDGEVGNRRRLLLLVAAGVLVVAVLGYFLAVTVLGGGNDQLPVGRSAPHLPGGALVATAPAVAPKVVPKSFAGVVGRDPFGALVTAPTGGGAAATGGAATTPTAAPTAPATTPATTPGMTTFKVLSVTGSKATVSVDTTKYTMNVGQVFAKTYKLLKTTGGSCASFAYGEMRFSLCEGQTFIF
ncbi:MAG: hypothetical protein M3O55_07950 [Actinomycetota bacterium]|nr:hypothetical protein [Actinomycetota bacterium]